MRCLVADDEPLLRHVIRRALTQLGHECSTVTTAMELEVAAAKEQPDAIISDIELGPDDGVAACARLLARRPGLKVLMISGNPGHGPRATAAGLGRVLAKPFTLEELQRALAERGIA